MMNLLETSKAGTVFCQRVRVVLRRNPTDLVAVGEMKSGAKQCYGTCRFNVYENDYNDVAVGHRGRAGIAFGSRS